MLPNPDLRLRPGMLLEVKIQRSNEPVLQIPEEALIQSAESDFVLRVRKPEGSDQPIAERIAVQVGRRRVGHIEILDGLDQDDQVVIEGIVPVEESIVADKTTVPVRIARVKTSKS